ncbi:hypothetical protein IT568_05765 [bacterium]|nr:hypothetical protein [bacterium]
MKFLRLFLIIFLPVFCFAQEKQVYKSELYNYSITLPNSNWFIPQTFVNNEVDVEFHSKDGKAVSFVLAEFLQEQNLDTIKQNLLDTFSTLYDSVEFSQTKEKNEITLEITGYGKENSVKYLFTAKTLKNLTLKNVCYAKPEEFSNYENDFAEFQNSLSFLQDYKIWFDKQKQEITTYYGKYLRFQVRLPSLFWKESNEIFTAPDLKFASTDENSRLYFNSYKNYTDSIDVLLDKFKKIGGLQETVFDSLILPAKTIYLLSGKDTNQEEILLAKNFLKIGSDLVEMSFFHKGTLNENLKNELLQIVLSFVELNNYENSLYIFSNFKDYEKQISKQRLRNFMFPISGNIGEPGFYKEILQGNKNSLRFEAFQKFGFFKESKKVLKNSLEIESYERLAFFNPKSNFLTILRPDLTENILRPEILSSAVHFLQSQNFDLRNDESNFDEFIAKDSFAKGERNTISILIDLERRKDTSNFIADYLNFFPTFQSWQAKELRENIFNSVRKKSSADSINKSLSIDWEEVEDFVFYELKTPEMAGIYAYVFLLKTAGFSTIDSVFQNSPKTTEQLLHPQKFWNYEGFEKIDLTKYFSVLKNWKVVYENNLGELYQQILLKIVFGENEKNDQNSPFYLSGTEGWNGDKYCFLANKNKTGLLFESSWDTEKDTQESFESYKKYLLSKYKNGKILKDTENNFGIRVGKDLNCIAKNKNHLLLLEGFSDKENEKLTEIFNRK